MKSLAKAIVWCISISIILVGVEVHAVTKLGCYCSSSGTEQDEVDVSQLKGLIKVDSDVKCQDFSTMTNSVTDAPSYQYCAWYENGSKKISWKMGAEIDTTKKNGCYCKKGNVVNHPSLEYEGCGLGAVNPSLGYDSCSWYNNDILEKTFTVENVGKCVAVKEGDYCGQFDSVDCQAQSINSPCIFANGTCQLAVNPDLYCSKFPVTSCQGYTGLCTWQGAGTDINKPVVDSTGVDAPAKTPSTFDATVLNRLGTTDVKVYIGRIIKGVMGILGSITLVMFVYSGILFMTDRGNGENVGKAKETAVWTSLGLVLVFASYAILSFVFQIFGK